MLEGSLSASTNSWKVKAWMRNEVVDLPKSAKNALRVVLLREPL